MSELAFRQEIPRNSAVRVVMSATVRFVHDVIFETIKALLSWLASEERALRLRAVLNRHVEKCQRDVSSVSRERVRRFVP